MPLNDELEKEVTAIFRSTWSERDGNVVPTDESIKLGNDAVKISATVLYADLADSTHLVDNNSKHIAAEIYKTFLHCAAKIIQSESGAITETMVTASWPSTSGALRIRKLFGVRSR